MADSLLKFLFVLSFTYSSISPKFYREKHHLSMVLGCVDLVDDMHMIWSCMERKQYIRCHF